MLMNIDEYKNKVRGCWLGKNAGGTLGAPFECKRGVLDIDFYTQDMSTGSWPNDDLDLQLVWLQAAERYGRSINASVLGEYWLSYITANWSEYGKAKHNMAKGLLPGFSGSYRNINKNSCGAFIRSEVWACLMPGHPELAVQYAFEDARVDHADEGVYGEIFFAAVESAAFTQSDCCTLIDIGLSYIPDSCAITLAVRCALDCYKTGLTWKEARKAILKKVPGIFGMYRGYEDREPESDVPVGEPGFDAPSNVGITVMAWLYGEGDFGKSICIAAGCLEDADCTAATVGALLGIIMGGNALPEKWIRPIGEGIKTVACSTVEGLRVPSNITELTDQIMFVMPAFMGRFFDACGGPVLHLKDPAFMKDTCGILVGTFKSLSFADHIKGHDLSVYMDSPAFKAKVTLPEGIEIQEGKELPISIELENLLGRQQWINITWYTPSEWSVDNGKKQTVSLEYFPGFGRIKINSIVTPMSLPDRDYTLIIGLTSEGRISSIYVPLKLINSPDNNSCYKLINNK